MRLSNFLIASSLLVCNVAGAALVAHWPGDGNNDDVAGGRDATSVNGTGYDTGAIGDAFQLDGNNDYLTVPDDNLWAFGSADFTIALWVNFDTVRPGGLGSLPNVFVGHDAGGGNVAKWVFFYGGASQLAFHINGSATNGFFAPPLSFSPVQGEWHHVAVRGDASGVAFFADGILLGTSPNVVQVPNVSALLTIGQAEGLGFLDGRLDDIRIYDDALTVGEVIAAGPGLLDDDLDDDGVLNAMDNCIFEANPTQLDTSGDGIGNLCDADLNDDCIVNPIDLGLFKAVFFTADADADFDGNGIVNVIDLGKLKQQFFAIPGPSAIANACE